MSHDFNLSGQVAIVTGSTSGIGLALAQGLAEQGVRVVLNGLGQVDAIEQVRAGLEAATGTPIAYHSADMTQPDQIADLVAFAQHLAGHARQRILCEVGVQHGVGDQVADLVGVSLGHGLGSE